MAGFPARRIYELHFEAEDLAGLEVQVRSTDVGTYLDLLRQTEAGFAKTSDDADAGLHRLAECLVAWNLEDDAGQPIPATYDGLKLVDKLLADAIVQAWTRVVAGVPAPLGRQSTSGQTLVDSPDLSELPMESAPASPPTSTVPS